MRIVAGNWKMNLLPEDARVLLNDLRLGLSTAQRGNAHVLILPPFPYIPMALEVLHGIPGVGVGAQHCHYAPSGAFTGEISAAMLAALGCSHVLVGHSERRTLFGETDEVVRRKVDAAVAAGLKPVVCVGEHLEVREANLHIEKVIQQVEAAMGHLTEHQMQSCVVAYEPVWAIGTGRTATAQQAAEMHAALHAYISGHWSTLSAPTPIVYGGSCTPANAAELFAQPHVSGGLIGGASLKAQDFLSIVRAAE